MSSTYPHNNNGMKKYIVLVISLIGLSVLYACDQYDVADNPGPPTNSFVPFSYDSKTEESIFLIVKNLNKLHAKTSTHLSFLRECRAKNIIPDGLRTNLPICASMPDLELEQKLSQLADTNSSLVMDVLIQHYDSKIFKVERDLQSAFSNLKNNTSGTSRFQYLVQCLQNFERKEVHKWVRI